MNETEVSNSDVCGIIVTNGGTINADNALKLPIGFQASNEHNAFFIECFEQSIIAIASIHD